MKKIKIQLAGGFHNSSPINVIVSENSYNDYKHGFISISELFSSSQIKKLDHHFCGCKDCTCGAFYRADVIRL